MLIEARGQIAADCVAWLLTTGWAKTVGYELQVVFKLFYWPRYADELHHAVCRVVADAPVCFENRHDAVVVSPEGHVVAGIEVLISAFGVNQPWIVETESAHQAADAVGD